MKGINIDDSSTQQSTSGLRAKLLILASTFPRWRNDHEPGFVFELAKRLCAEFEVVVLTPHAKSARADEILDGVKVVRYRYAPENLETLVHNGGIVANLKNNRWKWLLLPLFFLAQLWAVFRLCRRWQPDVVHAHWIIPQGLVMLIVALFARRGSPFLVTSHGGDLYGLRGRPLQWIKRKVLARAAAVSVVSTAMVDEVAELGVPSSEVLVLPMGADLSDRFVPGQAQSRSKSELLFVGRLVAKKGLGVLISAMPAIRAQVPEAHLTIVGFGPEETALRELSSRLGATGYIKFRGAVKQMHLPEHYQRAAAFIAPFIAEASGDQEGLPVALMEAIGCECPVVVGDVRGISDLLGDDQNARFPPGNQEALIEAVVAMLRDPQKASEAAVARRQQLMKKVDWDHAAEGYRSALRAIMRQAI